MLQTCYPNWKRSEMTNWSNSYASFIKWAWKFYTKYLGRFILHTKAYILYTVSRFVVVSIVRGGFKAESLFGHITRKASSPSLLLPPLPSPPVFPPLPSPPSLPLSAPPLFPLLPSLRSRPLKSSYGVWGSWSGAEPQPKSNLVHFSLKIWHLVATILMIFLRINWTNFMQFEH